MFQEERIKIITELLKKNGFVTVKFLTDELHYSSATINRDLNLMQKKKLPKQRQKLLLLRQLLKLKR